MKTDYPNRRRSVWRGRIFNALTLLLVLSLALHPELRLLAPFLDTLGLDVLLTLLGAQVAVFLAGAFNPCWTTLRQRYLPLILLGTKWLGATPGVRVAWRYADNLLAHGSGALGLYVWIRLAGLRAAWLGPVKPPRPTSLGGAT